MTKEKQVIEEEIIEAPVQKETAASFAEEETPVVDTTKKRKSNASVAPEKFDWDAFERETDYGRPKEEIAAEKKAKADRAIMIVANLLIIFLCLYYSPL